MKAANKLIIALILIIILIIGVGVELGVAIYKNLYFNINSSNIDSNSYLTSKYDSQSSFYYKENYENTGNFENFDFKKFNGIWSLIEFTSTKNNKITIEDNTKITKGKFYLVILDSNYNIIAKKDESTEKGNINFITPKDGKYLIRIAEKDSSGTFNIKINASNTIDISRKDLFQ